MQHSHHVRFMGDVIDISILVVITVSLCGMFKAVSDFSTLWQ